MAITSIIIPVYNESGVVITTLIRCCDLNINKEIIVVDNNSTDGSHALVKDFIESRHFDFPIILKKAEKQGKANAIKVGLDHARGDYIVFHDADLEYDPKYILEMVEFLETHDIVHGCRVCKPYQIGIAPFIANKVILNMVQRKYKTFLLDIFTGQRAYRQEVIRQMGLESGGFEMETELTIRALNEGYKIKEIDVTYKPRTRTEGKKIGLWDFLSILYLYQTLSYRVTREKKGRVIADAHER